MVRLSWDMELVMTLKLCGLFASVSEVFTLKAWCVCVASRSFQCSVTLFQDQGSLKNHSHSFKDTTHLKIEFTHFSSGL